MTRSPGTSAGFTLLEVLVALSMAAVLMLALQGTLRIARRARDSAVAKTSELRGMTSAFETIRRDLEAALPPGGILSGAFLGAPGGESFDSIQLFRLDADAYQSVYARPACMRKVELGVAASGGQDGSVLVRRVTRNLLAPRVVEPESQVILRGVRSFHARYFDGSVWLDSWDSTTQGDVLPAAVEVAIEVEGRRDRSNVGGSVEPIRATRLYALPCHREPDAAQQGASTGSAQGASQKSAGGGSSR